MSKRYTYDQPSSTVEWGGKSYAFGDDVTECGPEFWERYKCKCDDGSAGDEEE